LSIAKVEIEDTFISAIHILGVALFSSDGVPISACLDDDLEVVITCSHITSMMTTYDLRDPLTLMLSSEVVFHFIMGIRGVCYYPTLQLWDLRGAMLTYQEL